MLKTMNKQEKFSVSPIDKWFRLLSKRGKLIVLAMHNEGYAEDFRNVKNVELVLMSGIPPKRRYVENGVPCADYPSFDEIKDSNKGFRTHYYMGFPFHRKKTGFVLRSL